MKVESWQEEEKKGLQQNQRKQLKPNPNFIEHIWNLFKLLEQ